jgi:RimJ/RimL family protein N-acetyltransferase
MELRLQSCTLRPWRGADLDALVRHADNPKVANNLRDLFPHPYTRQAGRLFIEGAAPSPGRRWAIAVGGEACGGVGVHLKEREERRTAEIGYWLGEELWGRGIMTEVVGAVSAWAFRTYPDLLRLEAGVFEGNPGSMRVLEKNGYVLEGRMRNRIVKAGVVRDQLMYALLRTP